MCFCMWVVDAHWEGVGDGRISLGEDSSSSTPVRAEPAANSWGTPAPQTPRVGGLPPHGPPAKCGGFGGRQPPDPGGLGGGSPSKNKAAGLGGGSPPEAPGVPLEDPGSLSNPPAGVFKGSLLRARRRVGRRGWPATPATQPRSLLERGEGGGRTGAQQAAPGARPAHQCPRKSSPGDRF